VEQGTTGPDPGFFGLQQNIIGLPVLFRFQEFEFAGIVKTWTAEESAGRGQTYNVQVVAPGDLLRACTVIVGGEVRASNYVPNLLNPYALWEFDPQDDCDNLGESGNFRRGMPWNKLRSGLMTLTSVVNPISPITDFLQDGRIKYISGNNSGYGVIPETDEGYMLDIQELPLAPSYYRFAGPSENLLDIIEVLSTDFTFDWFAELVPVRYGGKILKFIKIRIIDRALPPAPDSIENFVQQRIQTGCGVISYNIGQEERDDALHTVLVGPNREQIYEATWQREDNPVTVQIPDWKTRIVEYDFKFYKRDKNGQKVENTKTVERREWYRDGFFEAKYYDLSNDFIAPYWGLDINENAIQSFCIDYYNNDPPPISSSIYAVANWNPVRDTEFAFPANCSSLHDKMFFLNIPSDFIELTEGELLAALAGQDDWESYMAASDSGTGAIISIARLVLGIGAAGGLFDMKQLISNPNKFDVPARFLKPMHMLSTRRISGHNDILQEMETDVRTVYEWVLRYAQEFYGLKFQVRVPDICVVRDPETGEFKANFELDDGYGWYEYNNVESTSLQAIPIPSTYIDFFRDSNGRVGPFCRFDGAQNLIYDNLSTDQYGYFDPGGLSADLWVKCETEGIVFGDYANLADPRVIISLPQAIRYKPRSFWSEEVGPRGWSINPSSSLAGLMTNIQDNITEAGVVIGGQNKHYPERAAQPLSVSFALVNKDVTYGPWGYTNGSNIGGNVRYEQDTLLAPWNFGSMAALDTVAIAQASTTVSNMYFAESGTVTIPGMPEHKIGDEILSVQGSGYIAGQYGFQTRTSSTRSAAIPGFPYQGCDLITGVGYWVGDGGPNVTQMKVSVSESGYTTQYILTAFAGAVKKASKVRVNRMKEVAKLRQDILRNG
jgi:hypothetical protein